VGNIIGSNLFNTLAVVGLAGTIHPMQVPAEVLSRDWPLMFALTVLILFIGIVQRSKPISQIGRIGGAFLLAVYIGYTVYLISTAL
jgi:cation:H+ antiporter